MPKSHVQAAMADQKTTASMNRAAPLARDFCSTTCRRRSGLASSMSSVPRSSSPAVASLPRATAKTMNSRGSRMEKGCRLKNPSGVAMNWFLPIRFLMTGGSVSSTFIISAARLTKG